MSDKKNSNIKPISDDDIKNISGGMIRGRRENGKEYTMVIKNGKVVKEVEYTGDTTVDRALWHMMTELDSMM